jgi:dihydroxy-acid dehydratase
MDKPQVGVASVWFEGNPCNMHLLQLAEKVKAGLAAAGLVGILTPLAALSAWEVLLTPSSAYCRPSSTFPLLTKAATR